MLRDIWKQVFDSIPGLRIDCDLGYLRLSWGVIL